MGIAAIIRGVLALAGLLLLSTGDVLADGPPAPGELVKAGLIAETASIAPGATVWVTSIS